MDESDASLDQNAAIWKSPEVVASWAAQEGEREQRRVTHRRVMAELLPFAEQEAFTFLDIGAGTGAATRTILAMYPQSSAIMADFSPQMMAEGENEMAPFAGRYRYVEFDLTTGDWPAEIPSALDAVVSSMVIHHLSDDRKQAVFAGILEHLSPGGWYLNYDPVASTDADVESAWQRVNDRIDPSAAHHRHHRTAHEQERFENHTRYLIPLDPQLGFLRDAGFRGVDAYWKHLDHAIFGGFRVG